MKLLTSFTGDYGQQLSFTLDDGSNVQMSLNYVPSQNGWFYSLVYPTLKWEVDNRRLVNSPNLLREFRNVIPFGLCCITTDGYEIINLSDLISGRASIYVLNSTDVLQTETLILNTLPNFVTYPLN